MRTGEAHIRHACCNLKSRPFLVLGAVRYTPKPCVTLYQIAERSLHNHHSTHYYVMHMC